MLDVVHLERLDVGAYAPTRVAVDPQGRFYITDPRKGRLFITDAHGNNKVTIAPGIYPAGIAIGTDGRLYLGEVLTQAVYVFDAQGNYLHDLGDGEGEFGWPNDIAVDPVSRMVYVADSQTNEIRAYDSEGTYQFNITITGDGSDADPFTPLSFPSGVAVDPVDGRVVVSDHNNKKLQVFNSAGNWLYSIADLTRPQGLTIDDEGNIFVADAFKSKVYVYDSAGAALGEVGQYGDNPGDLKVPTDAALDPYGRLVVTSYNNGVLEIYGPEGYTLPPAEVEPPAITSLSISIQVYVSVVFEPETLKLSSKGNWFDAYIEPVGRSAADIDVSTVLLNDQVPADLNNWELVDKDEDGILELKVSFDRQAVESIIDPSAAEAQMVVSGDFGCNLFKCYFFNSGGTIKIVASSKKTSSTSNAGADLDNNSQTTIVSNNYNSYEEQLTQPTSSITVYVETTVAFNPVALNLSSNGNWFIAYIEPVDGSAAEIEVASILLNDQIPADIDNWELVDQDNDGLLELKVSFDRREVVSMIDPAATEAELVVSGSFGCYRFNCYFFTADDNIVVIK